MQIYVATAYVFSFQLILLIATLL